MIQIYVSRVSLILGLLFSICQIGFGIYMTLKYEINMCAQTDLKMCGSINGAIILSNLCDFSCKDMRNYMLTAAFYLSIILSMLHNFSKLMNIRTSADRFEQLFDKIMILNYLIRSISIFNHLPLYSFMAQPDRLNITQFSTKIENPKTIELLILSIIIAIPMLIPINIFYLTGVNQLTPKTKVLNSIFIAITTITTIFGLVVYIFIISMSSWVSLISAFDTRGPSFSLLTMFVFIQTLLSVFEYLSFYNYQKIHRILYVRSFVGSLSSVDNDCAPGV
jgi:hypothetical protein